MIYVRTEDLLKLDKDWFYNITQTELSAAETSSHIAKWFARKRFLRSLNKTEMHRARQTVGAEIYHLALEKFVLDYE